MPLLAYCSAWSQPRSIRSTGDWTIPGQAKISNFLQKTWDQFGDSRYTCLNCCSSSIWVRITNTSWSVFCSQIWLFHQSQSP